MITISNFIAMLPFSAFLEKYGQPWEIADSLKIIIPEIIAQLNSDYSITNGIAIHKSVVLEQGVTLKSPLIIMQGCRIGAHAYFREGVILGQSVNVGPGSELKSSVICSDTSIAHLNYIGNSIIGSNVNFEAGSIVANHYNERQNKQIRVSFENVTMATGVEKFGALVGDDSKIGANAVLSPGTILRKHTIVKRLELLEQLPENSSNQSNTLNTSGE